jgi:hypothetical protein
MTHWIPQPFDVYEALLERLEMPDDLHAEARALLLAIEPGGHAAGLTPKAWVGQLTARYWPKPG